MQELCDSLTIVQFSEEIEHKYIHDKSESHLTTIIKYCEENGVDYEHVIKYIAPSLKEKIKLEAEERGWMRRTSQPVSREFF